MSGILRFGLLGGGVAVFLGIALVFGAALNCPILANESQCGETTVAMFILGFWLSALGFLALGTTAIVLCLNFLIASMRWLVHTQLRK
jgi:hypothetical protein